MTLTHERNQPAWRRENSDAVRLAQTMAEMRGSSRLELQPRSFVVVNHGDTSVAAVEEILGLPPHPPMVFSLIGTLSNTKNIMALGRWRACPPRA